MGSSQSGILPTVSMHTCFVFESNKHLPEPAPHQGFLYTLSPPKAEVTLPVMSVVNIDKVWMRAFLNEPRSGTENGLMLFCTQ